MSLNDGTPYADEDAKVPRTSAQGAGVPIAPLKSKSPATILEQHHATP